MRYICGIATVKSFDEHITDGEVDSRYLWQQHTFYLVEGYNFLNSLMPAVAAD